MLRDKAVLESEEPCRSARSGSVYGPWIPYFIFTAFGDLVLTRRKISSVCIMWSASLYASHMHERQGKVSDPNTPGEQALGSANEGFQASPTFLKPKAPFGLEMS
ncbi:hypothetical protein VNO77_07621 [Canavalia gladiata]|uniref:Uncharacterized protein n=1 Tax=Canavalia gladiata TaxID=3824 RepID=A0AAN9M9B5_CANGL